jgi:hypothetical protein
MNTRTIEVAIDHGKLTALEPHLLPETGRGWLTVVPSPNARPRQRVQLPLIKCQPGTVIAPTKAELDGSLWD